MIASSHAPRDEPALRRLVLYFLGLGSWGFGGPVVLVERMRRARRGARLVRGGRVIGIALHGARA